MNVDQNILIQMLSILIGPVGVVIGIVLQQYFLNKDKKFLFSENYFNKKLDIYEKLHLLILETREMLSALLETDPTREQIQGKFSAQVFKVANFLDMNELYVNEAITVHIMFILFETLDYPDKSNKKKEMFKEETLKNWKNIIEAMREDLGFYRLDKELHSLNASRGHLKTMQEYLDDLNKEYKK